jgi:hypothetical protein
MSIRFDDKGKFFTEVVSKETTGVMIQTPTHRIEGKIHIRPGERLKDEINQAEPFFAVTEAIIFDNAGVQKFKSDFLIVYRDFIIWIMPLDAAKPTGAQPQGGVS